MKAITPTVEQAVQERKKTSEKKKRQKEKERT